jgi:hypothetical protein
MASIETVSIVIAAVSVVIGVINSIRSNQKADQQRQTEIQTRQAELFMQMYHDWSTPEFRKAIARMNFQHSWSTVDEFTEKYGWNNLDEWINTYVRQATVYEGIGVLVEQGLIDIELVDRLLHNTTIYFWERIGPVIAEYRKLAQAPGHHPLLDSTEYLYNLIKQRGHQTTSV